MYESQQTSVVCFYEILFVHLIILLKSLNLCTGVLEEIPQKKTRKKTPAHCLSLIHSVDQNIAKINVFWNTS